MRISKFISTIALSVILVAPVSAADFQLFSSDISEGMQLSADSIFEGFGCTGGNTAPALAWENAPEGTKSFAITAYDPDAPTGSGWWHWFAFNIPAEVTNLNSGEALPEGAVELTNDYGTKGFGGACPPPGEVHRYQFTVHALPIVLEIDSTVSNALAGFMVRANAIASSTIAAVYSR